METANLMSRSTREITKSKGTERRSESIYLYTAGMRILSNGRWSG